MGLEEKAGDMGIVTTTLETVVNWGRTNAMWPLLFGLACCAIEMMGAQASNYDVSRFGMEINRASPRQADLMIVAGRVSRKMAPVVRRLYDQMSDPKWVIAMGDCASCAGVFNNYAIVQGVDEIVPVDVYIAGCPPRPEALIDGIMLLHEKVRRTRITGVVRELEPIHV
jgi:NADH-quinone oxidoreductase subunit B